MPATMKLSNGHLVEVLLFNSVCKMLKKVASIHETIEGPKHLKNVWTGQIAISRLCKKAAYSKYEMDFRSAELLSKFNLCNNNGSITENIRNIVLSLCDMEDNITFMTVPPIADDDDPILAQEIISLGPVLNFPPNKNPR